MGAAGIAVGGLIFVATLWVYFDGWDISFDDDETRTDVFLLFTLLSAASAITPWRSQHRCWRVFAVGLIACWVFAGQGIWAPLY